MLLFILVLFSTGVYEPPSFLMAHRHLGRYYALFSNVISIRCVSPTLSGVGGISFEDGKAGV